MINARLLFPRPYHTSRFIPKTSSVRYVACVRWDKYALMVMDEWGVEYGVVENPGSICHGPNREIGTPLVVRSGVCISDSFVVVDSPSHPSST